MTTDIARRMRCIGNYCISCAEELSSAPVEENDIIIRRALLTELYEELEDLHDEGLLLRDQERIAITMQTGINSIIDFCEQALGDAF